MKINNELLQLAYEHYSLGNSLNETREWLSTFHNIIVGQQGLGKIFLRNGSISAARTANPLSSKTWASTST